jgi:hypothetical protein
LAVLGIAAAGLSALLAADPEMRLALRTRGQPHHRSRCPQPRLPRVVFEIVSPSELRKRRERDRKRRDEQGVEGVLEIVELFQDEAAAHI